MSSFDALLQTVAGSGEIVMVVYNAGKVTLQTTQTGRGVRKQ
jgi:hypothetical protein